MKLAQASCGDCRRRFWSEGFVRHRCPKCAELHRNGGVTPEARDALLRHGLDSPRGRAQLKRVQDAKGTVEPTLEQIDLF